MELTREESDLFGLLMAVVAESGCGSVVRVAGGWVRDKLLGIADGGGDIDLVVDNMPAVDFADLLARHRPSETKGGKVIASRPDLHKHVEVVALKLLDGSAAVELSSHHGRTPEAEARRRDFTINSLLYNINLAVVEDFTGMGLEDLRAGVIRTPLAPAETLGQDPLRILRCIRFATRFDFRVDEQLAAAMKDAVLQNELNTAIGRQRIVIEVTKMLSGPRPAAALLAMCEDDLHRIVFTPSKAAGFWTDELTQLSCLAVRSVMTSYADGRSDGPALVPELSRLVFWLACLFLPLCLSPQCLKDRERDTHLPFTKWDMREYWRARPSFRFIAIIGSSSAVLPLVLTCIFPDQVANAVFLQLARAHDLEDLALSYAATGTADKLGTARVLRELGPSWVHALQLAHVLASLRQRHQRTDKETSDDDDDDGGLAQSFSRLSEWITRESGLLAGPYGPAVWAVAPLVSAKDLLAALARPAAGKDVGRLVALALDWQLAHHDSNSNSIPPSTATSEYSSSGGATALIGFCVSPSSSSGGGG